MTRHSYDLNDLHSDLTHLSTLINVITEKALEIPDIGDVTGLLWIARAWPSRSSPTRTMCARANAS
jgi:hypothetical protein